MFGVSLWSIVPTEHLQKLIHSVFNRYDAILPKLTQPSDQLRQCWINVYFETSVMFSNFSREVSWELSCRHDKQKHVLVFILRNLPSPTLLPFCWGAAEPSFGDLDIVGVEFNAEVVPAELLGNNGSNAASEERI